MSIAKKFSKNCITPKNEILNLTVVNYFSTKQYIESMIYLNDHWKNYVTDNTS